MARFCVTARISRPKRVKRSSPSSATKTASAKADDPQPVIGDGDAAEIEGAAHERRIADLAVVRAERRAHRLLQDQRKPPGRQQRLQRPAVEKADDAALDQDADEAGDQERQRNGDGERVVEQRRMAGADRILHHEGHIGADHHHFAVRHVDDAHHAEGDGEPNGREQQHRAERNAVPGVLHRVPDAEAVADGGGGAGGGFHDRRRGAGGKTLQKPERVLIAALLDHRDGGELVLVLGVVAGEQDRGARLHQHPLDARVLFLLDGALERRQRALVARFEHRLRRVQPLGRVGRHQRQRAERGVDAAAQPVVDADSVEIGRRIAGDRLSGRGVGQLAVVVLDVDRLALGAEHEMAVLQGADDGFRPRAAARGDGADAVIGVVEIVGGEFRQRVVEARGVRARAGQNEAEGQQQRGETSSAKTHCKKSREALRGKAVFSPPSRKLERQRAAVTLRRRTSASPCCSCRT